jgi:multiple sugar transport system substrate-binding protein
MNTIPAKSQNKDGAWQFLTWYSSLDTTLAKLKIQGMPSPRKDFYETKEWKDAVAAIPQRARVPEIAALGDIYPFARYTRVNEVFDPAMQAMFVNNTSPAQGMTDLQNKINAILPQTPQA